MWRALVFAIVFSHNSAQSSCSEEARLGAVMVKGKAWPGMEGVEGIELLQTRENNSIINVQTTTSDGRNNTGAELVKHRKEHHCLLTYHC